MVLSTLKVRIKNMDNKKEIKEKIKSLSDKMIDNILDQRYDNDFTSWFKY